MGCMAVVLEAVAVSFWDIDVEVRVTVIILKRCYHKEVKGRTCEWKKEIRRRISEVTWECFSGDNNEF